VRALNNKALCLYKLERYEESVKNLDLAVEVDPFFSRTYYLKARNLRNMGKFKKCLQMLSLVCEITQDDIGAKDSFIANDEWIGNVFCEYGKILALKGQPNKAMGILDSAIDRYGHIDGLIDKGILYLEMSKYELAIKSFETFLNLIKADYFLFRVCDPASEAFDSDNIRTIEDNQRKKKIYILENICNYYKAITLKYMKKHKEAIDLFNVIIEKDPDNP
jgi:tetratricopeptide (TPR) repeat protein